MDKKQVAGLVAFAVSAYPNQQKQEQKLLCRAWELTLADMDYETAQTALAMVISRSKFFPTVAEIREAAAQLSGANGMDWSEAWGLVARATHRFGYYQEEKGLESLPEPVRRMVKRFNWREICSTDNIDVIRGQFRMAWEGQSKRERDLAVLPAPLRERLEAPMQKALGEGKHEQVGSALAGGLCE